jgi:hypothetical protein
MTDIVNRLRAISTGLVSVDSLYEARVAAQLAAGEIKQYREAMGRFYIALAMYANPESYHAIAFAVDRPAGEFADDFEEDHGHSFYNRPMPGKLARQAMAEVAKKFPELTMIVEE